MTFDIGLHEVCVRVGVLYVITKFSRMDSLPNFLTHGAPLRARFARARSSAIIIGFQFWESLSRLIEFSQFSNYIVPGPEPRDFGL